MTHLNDMTSFFKDMMGAFPIDAKSFEETMKGTTALNEKFASVAVEAAEKSAEISNKWTKDTLSRLSAISKATNRSSRLCKGDDRVCFCAG